MFDFWRSFHLLETNPLLLFIQARIIFRIPHSCVDITREVLKVVRVCLWISEAGHHLEFFRRPRFQPIQEKGLVRMKTGLWKICGLDGSLNYWLFRLSESLLAAFCLLLYHWIVVFPFFFIFSLYDLIEYIFILNAVEFGVNRHQFVIENDHVISMNLVT